MPGQRGDRNRGCAQINRNETVGAGQVADIGTIDAQPVIGSADSGVPRKRHSAIRLDRAVAIDYGPSGTDRDISSGGDVAKGNCAV